MATPVKFNRFTQDLLKGTHVFGTNVFKLLLTNTLPVVTNTIPGNITQIANGNGYTTGGLTVTIGAPSTASGVAKIVATDLIITATGAVGPFRYGVLYNDTASDDALICWIDLGQQTMANLDVHTVDFNGTTGLLNL